MVKFWVVLVKFWNVTTDGVKEIAELVQDGVMAR
jgi:hypothetical protein